MQQILATLGFEIWDLVGLIFFSIAWFGYAAFAEYRRHRCLNLLGLMNRYRHRWMLQMLKRQNRMMDATMIGNLLRSISFFASTSVLILFGVVTLLGQRERGVEILSTLPFAADASAFLWEIKILLLALIFVYAFFKFTWSLRQYNYACIYVGAAPEAGENPDEHEMYATQGAQLIGNAARHFNMGLRAFYFGMAALSWFVGPVAFILATFLVVVVSYRREFHSRTMDFISHFH